MSEGALGLLVLAGSGEYTPAMDVVDRFLLDRTADKPVLLIATSCAQEGLHVMEKWEQMGVAHFRSLGVEALPLRIADRADANNPEHAEAIKKAGVVWFSGGSPIYLAQSFADTLAFNALEAANRAGLAVAGSSGGLGVLNANVPSPDPNVAIGTTALGLAAPVRALAHFDRMEARRPEFIDRILGNLQPGQMAVGLDEDTAVVWTERRWQVMGHKRAVVFNGGERVIFKHGDIVAILPPPLRAREGS
jgi:cyanophycinase